MYMYTYVYVVYIYKNMYIYMYMHTYIYVHTHTTRIYIWQVAVLANIIPTLLDAAPGRRVRSAFKKRSRTFAKAISVVRLSLFLSFWCLCFVPSLRITVPFCGSHMCRACVCTRRAPPSGSPDIAPRECIVSRIHEWVLSHVWMSHVRYM